MGHDKMDAIISELQTLHKDMERLYSLMQRMPEIQAAVFLTEQETAERVKWNRQKLSDYYLICPPNER